MEYDWDIRIAIVSDLHCHEEAVKPRESWLIAGAARKPDGHHPVQALLSLIRRDEISAEVIVCPGDLANKVSNVGMMQSWDHLCELKRELKSTLLVTTLGNHDVDCYKKHNPDPFHIPRNLVETFPAPTDEALNDFWSSGFYLVDGPSGSEFLVLNTVIEHNDEATARRGTFGEDRIRNLDRLLTNRNTTDTLATKRFPIAVMHHHPLLHSSSSFGSTDVLEFGDQLLKVLSKHGFRLILHGHRHEPRITRLSPAAGDQVVLAAGSFSAILGELATSTRNLFHMVRIRSEETNMRFVGEVLTWEFNKGVGWIQATIVSAALPHIVRFSCPRPTISVIELYDACVGSAGNILRSNDLNKRFPQIELFLPEELDALNNELAKKNMKLVLDKLGTPDYVGIVDGGSR